MPLLISFGHPVAEHGTNYNKYLVILICLNRERRLFISKGQVLCGTMAWQRWTSWFLSSPLLSVRRSKRHHNFTTSTPFLSLLAAWSCVVRSGCESLLGDREVLSLLRSKHYDVAVMDLMSSMCPSALAHSMSVPIIGFVAASPTGVELEATGKKALQVKS